VRRFEWTAGQKSSVEHIEVGLVHLIGCYREALAAARIQFNRPNRFVNPVDRSRYGGIGNIEIRFNPTDQFRPSAARLVRSIHNLGRQVLLRRKFASEEVRLELRPHELTGSRQNCRRQGDLRHDENGPCPAESCTRAAAKSIERGLTYASS